MPQRESNLDMVRDYVAAFNSGGFDAIVDRLDPEIEYHEDPKFPQAQVYRGRDSVVRQWREFGASFEDYRIEVETEVEVEERVVSILRELGRGAGSGVPVDRRTGWIHTLSRGKIARVEIFLDPADALEAAGLKP